ncbi:MAG: methyl-accepting chemotaxis protein, partial [Jaaginema sp. PMC 1078.18]|nr:methyl-accepting chemotaxis protein [Jaaginema sp. PMC 1078.18]
DIKIRYWIVAGYCVPILLSIVSAIIVYINVQIVREQKQKLQNTTEISQIIAELAFDAQNLSRSTRGYMLDRSNISLNVFESSRNQIPLHLQELEGLITDAQQVTNLARIRESVTQLETINARLIDLVNQGQTPRAIEVWKQDSGRAQSEALAGLLQQFRNREQEILSNTQQSQEQALNTLVLCLWISLILSVAIAATLGSWIIINIAQRLNQTATTLATSSSQIATTIEEQERTASQQAASVNQTTATMDELGASSRQSAEQAEAASRAAQRVRELAEGGNLAVAETLDNMANLKNKVGAIAEQILRLSEQTNQIGSISRLVSDLANQTNMLALNAAVEAVRAGEHGKGFAVVAAEIRKLADQSQQSAQKINVLVADVQNAINSTVMVTDEGTKTVEAGMQVTQKTSQAFAGVTEAIANVVVNNQQISLNIQQQATAIQQVVQAMNNLNQGAKETATGISQTRLGTQKLNEATLFLKEIV